MIKLERSEVVAWNDPRGWGFCEACAFLEPTDVIAGWILAHHHSVGNSGRLCDGSGRAPTLQPAPEVKPLWTSGMMGPPQPKDGVSYGPEPEPV